MSSIPGRSSEPTTTAHINGSCQTAIRLVCAPRLIWDTVPCSLERYSASANIMHRAHDFEFSLLYEISQHATASG